MHDSKDIAWAREYDEPTAEVADADRNGGHAANESDADGWQQYRPTLESRWK